MDYKNRISLLLGMVMLSAGIVPSCGPRQDSAANDDFEKQVEEYLRALPYQETHTYALMHTQGDSPRLNVWAQSVPALIKAGEDKIVRTNNDTLYKIAFVVLESGPVALGSSAPVRDRFYSFQLMDDRNVNYRNVIHPEGRYTLYHGEKPARIEGEAIEVPSNFSVVILRVEVKDKNDPRDMAAAKAVFDGITIEGPKIRNVPELDLLGEFDEKVEEEASRRMDETMTTVPVRDLIVGFGQKPGREVSYLRLAAGTKEAWGGPDPSHSTYEARFTDEAGKTLVGANGVYTVTTTEPPVEAFWSVTVYDTERGGFLHPNEHDRYHINDTGAVMNADGTVTFTFRPRCEEVDLNCLEVPEGRFDVATRYYLPGKDVISGEWSFPKLRLRGR